MPTEDGHPDAPYLLDLPTFEDERGRITVAETGEAVPFDIERLYYLYDVPPDTTRGKHAHRKLKQIMVALSGSLDVTIEGQFGRDTYRLDSPKRGLFVPAKTWRELSNFSNSTTCLVIASHRYDPSDYIHDLRTFRDLIGHD